MNKDATLLALMLMALAVSHVAFDELPYAGYAIAFATFALTKWSALTGPQLRRSPRSSLGYIWYAVGGVVVCTTLAAEAETRDILRDMGSILSFLFGLLLLPRAIKWNWSGTLLPAMSMVGIVISLWTIAGAAAAYIDGVGAYRWRGEYLPFAHAWLPYLFLADFMLLDDRRRPDRGSILRMSLCAAAIILSLSRTGLFLLAAFGFFLLSTRIISWTNQPRNILRTILAVLALGVIVPQILTLDVVQERIERGVGDGDESLGWRDMENDAAIDMLNSGGGLRWAFGFGLGARVPLPAGIVDFNGNTKIPHLHNSYYTILIKSGLFGLAALLWTVYLLLKRAYGKRKGPHSYQWPGGAWLLIFIMGFGYTLHGLSQWSHLLLFGIAAAMLLDRGPRFSGSAPPKQKTGSWLATQVH